MKKTNKSNPFRDFCSRQDTFFYELRHDWDNLNLASKLLLFIGLILFVFSISILFIDLGDDTIINSIEVVFRTCLSSIFGFFLSSSLNGAKKGSKTNLVIREQSEPILPDSSVNEEDTSCNFCAYKYNYKDGNLIRILLACFISLVCIIVLWICMTLGSVSKIASLSQLRDLMCSSIGFLLGESRIKKD